MIFNSKKYNFTTPTKTLVTTTVGTTTTTPFGV